MKNRKRSPRSFLVRKLEEAKESRRKFDEQVLAPMRQDAERKHAEAIANLHR